MYKLDSWAAQFCSKFTPDDKPSRTNANERNVHWGAVPPIGNSLQRLVASSERKNVAASNQVYTDIHKASQAPSTYKKKGTYPEDLYASLGVFDVFVQKEARQVSSQQYPGNVTKI